MAVGIAVLDDYGISSDESTQRALSIVTAKYIWGFDDTLLTHWDRFYGVGFEMPLLLAEYLLGLEDSRDIYLMRHILSHTFFVTGGFFCYLLAYRMFNNRLVALFALLLFLLHPRIYAHSFFNTKDLPFLSMFMIALYFTHRAFGKNTVPAFLLCGVAVGILTNIRILGVMLFAAILVMRAFDLYYASGRGARKRILITGGLFAAAAMLSLYVTWPWLWGDPLGRLLESFTRMSDYPNTLEMLYRGEYVLSTDVPWDYIPVWIIITTPLVTLLLGGLGLASLCCRGITGPGTVLRNTATRFGFLLTGCLILPVLASILLGSNLYDGWRQMYFLYAFLCLLAAGGLHCSLSFFQCRPRLRVPLRAGVYGLAGAGLLARRHCDDSDSSSSTGVFQLLGGSDNPGVSKQPVLNGILGRFGAGRPGIPD